MTPTELGPRVRRQEGLSIGLAREAVRVKEASDPLLYLERKAYLKAIQDALAGVEAARVALAPACQRLEGDRGPWPPAPQSL